MIAMIAPEIVDDSVERVTPRASRLYWTCQFAGWGGFAAYVCGGYLVFSPVRDPVVVASMLLFNGVGCPLVTHGLRAWMYAHAWHQRPVRQLLPRALAAAILLGGVLTILVAVLNVARAGTLSMKTTGLWWTFAAFCWALAGWQIIYGAVQSRRRLDRLQLEFTLRVREAQLDSLRAQMNPHFLFNALNSLRGLINEDPERAGWMVTALGDLLRYALTSGRRQTVSLAEELDIVDQYLALEKIRLEERLTIERALEPATLSVPIPPMLVQSLVENAVKHGISCLPAGGTVRITSRVSDDGVEIVISNTGTLRPASTVGGFGLQSVHDRLQLTYAGRASLALRDADGTTVAKLTLPVESCHESLARR
jgi:hypothetical protein